MAGEYPWHRHPNSDECFLVLERTLEIDFGAERTVTLGPNEMFTIPAGVRHRTRAGARERQPLLRTVRCARRDGLR